MEEILVSIWCATYNHELYINDAIESFLAQRTNFKYEIIIHDDASIDKTVEIVKKYEQKYPDIIHGIYQAENQNRRNYPSSKWVQQIQIQHCKGKYIAVCEGDDYWIDVQKLQLQVDYLETHSECIMTIHNGIVVDYRSGKIYARDLYEKDCYIQCGDAITQRIIPLTASMVYRREAIDMDEFYRNVGIGDYPSLLYCLTKGKIYYFNRIMSAYRFMHPSSWTSSVLANKDSIIIHNVLMINFLRKFNAHTKKIYEKYVLSRIQKSITRILEAYENLGKEEFFNICRMCNKKENYIYDEIFRQLQDIYTQLKDKNYISLKTVQFIDNNKRLLIMGAGKYAKIIAEQLTKRKIFFEGFVVSDNQSTNRSYLGKHVWKLGEISKDVGIIVGINPIIWDQIIDSLAEAQIEHYICPFLME